jgi:hypothetical protein
MVRFVRVGIGAGESLIALWLDAARREEAGECFSESGDGGRAVRQIFDIVWLRRRAYEGSRWLKNVHIGWVPVCPVPDKVYFV